MKVNRNLAALAALVLGLANVSGAQVTSSLQTISLGAVKGEFITLGAPSPSSQSVSLVDAAVNQYTTPFSTSVSWDVTASASTTVKLVAYFANPAQALANGTDYIPSSKVEVSTDAGATWTPISGGAVGGVGTALGSVVLYTSPVTTGAGRAGTQSVTFLVRINLLPGPTTIAGSYAGTLNLMSACN